jgi:hypothetical protein
MHVQQNTKHKNKKGGIKERKKKRTTIEGINKVRRNDERRK